MKRDLIKEIEKIDLSNTVKIIDILTYDFKDELGINFKNIFIKMSNMTNVEKFLKYRIISSIKYQYTHTLIDCDTTDLTKNILTRIYFKDKYDYVSVDENNRTYSLSNGSIFESDTMNSFQTIFGAYMRCFIQREHVKKLNCSKLYGQDYNVNSINSYKEAELYRNFWTLENFNDIKLKAKDGKEREILDELEIFAGLTHTVGNFALVPYKCNTYRGIDQRLSDYWDLSYDKFVNCTNIEKLSEDIVEKIRFKENKEKIKEKIIKSVKEYKNIKKIYDKFEIISKYRPTSKVYSGFVNDNDINSDIEEEIYLNILKEINQFIIKRGINIILDISQKSEKDLLVKNEELIQKVRNHFLKK